MLKNIILVTNLQKSSSAGSPPPPEPLNLRFWWPEVTWCGQISFFQADYDEMELQKIHYDVILVTSLSLCHRKRHKKFPFWSPFPSSPIKISGYASDIGCHEWAVPISVACAKGPHFKFAAVASRWTSYYLER